ncbi:hypothetical protein [Massilia glaciei]|uniref:Tetratricopeptide repeat protein n=1 Tax=Massilia glaciei TaxID=1524097 RepID=A0A2U2I7H0_9BURK|nr:hypothetical protein [Massilia glaciei]PWF55688.1 hypothetical protein C7C56_000405 [Massilia glaciei]
MSTPIYSLACALLLAAAAPALQAAPYLPASGGEVLEQLPRRADPAQRELRRMRAELAAEPRNLALATRTAQSYISTARDEADPRYYGYAQAALAPWWGQAAPPHEVRLLRATLMQSTHHFPEALADLDAIVKVDPGNAQAWLTRATVMTVRGDYTGATASCARLSQLTLELVTITCISSVTTMTGRSAKSEALLASTLARNGEAGAEMQSWTLTLLGEMAERRGDAALAEARYKRALAMSPRDSYLIGAYADFLLERKRPREALALVKDRGRVDTLLLRQALALRQIGGGAGGGSGEELRAASAELGARFEAAARRGDSVHQREQARYELHVRGDGKAGLALARKNWAVQKEAADIRLLLEAALMARDKAAAAPALAWIGQHGYEDVAAARLARQIAALS